jgi:tRNA(Ile)-lysidine synthetase-like protein
VHLLAQRVLSHIRRQELLRAGERVGVAVSGGIDSVALSRLLIELRGELGIVLSIVHFNHKLRGAESDADEQFVANLARERGLEFYVDSDDVGAHAAEERVSVEAAARELRYGFFQYLLDAEGSTSGAEAPVHNEPGDRSAESAAPPKAVACLNKIVTGHTLDDQAETVLMRMIRGAGTRGLGGIHPRIVLEEDDGGICGEIVRPLLGIRRRELKAYLFDVRQEWREDSSNADHAYTRNRVRQLLVPLLEKEFNPGVAGNLAELAEIARDEEDYWENEVAGWMGTAVHWSPPEWAKDAAGSGLVQIGGAIHPQAGASGKSAPQGLKPPTKEAPLRGPKGPLFHSDAGGTAEAVPFHESDVDAHGNATTEGASMSEDVQSRIDAAPWLVANAAVDRMWFLGEPVAVQRRLIKAIGDHAGIPLEFKHVEEIRRCAENEASGKEVSLPLGWRVVREPDVLVFVTPDLRQAEPGLNYEDDYEYEVSIPGRIAVAKLSSDFEVCCLSADEASGYNPDQLLDAQSLARSLRLRNWRPGDRFWPAHTKSPRKVKELLQERHVPQPERKLWPVAVSGDEIVWVRGFPTHAKFQPRPGQEAVLIVEKPLRDDS